MDKQLLELLQIKNFKGDFKIAISKRSEVKINKI